MPHQCKVFDSKGELIRTHTVKELEKRSDLILKIGYKKFLAGEKIVKRQCSKCNAEFYPATKAAKYCLNCRVMIVPDIERPVA